jgi:type IX secretion system PorP/SprF family membrane protein
MYKHIIIFLLFLGCAALSRAQQDPQYSQYMFNHVAINPAYAGSKQALSATAVVRKQWVGVDGAPKTNSLSLHGPVKSKRIGLGIHLTEEQIGPKRWMGAYGDFSYSIRLGNGKLAFGLAAGAVSYKYNFNQVSYVDPSEVANSNELNKNRVRFDASFGVYYHTKAWFAGYSMTHLNEPNLYNIVSSDTAGSSSVLTFNLRRHHFVTLGYGFRLGDNLVFSPSILVKSTGTKNGTNADLNLNFLIHQKLWLGASVRSSKTLVVLAQYTIKDIFKIGYAYDMGFSKFTRNKGSHEIMLGYIFTKNKSAVVSPRYL